LIRSLLAWPDPGKCLREAIARDRAIAVGVPWCVTREQRQRRAALLEGAYEPEIYSLEGLGWTFDGHVDQESGGVSREEYMRNYQKTWRKRKTPAGHIENGEPAGVIVESNDSGLCAGSKAAIASG